LWRSKPKENAKEKEARFLQRCGQYAELEELCNVRCRDSLRQFDVDPKRADFENAESMAATLSKQFQLGAHPAASLEKTLENQYGVKIWYEDLGIGASAASTIGDFGPAILMNRNEAPWRRNYNFGHEVFHLVTLKSISVELLQANRQLSEKIEKLANAFASHLLLPADVLCVSFYDRVGKNKISCAALIELAREFDVSIEAVLYRLAGLRLLSKATVNSILEDPSFRELDRSSMSVHWWEPPPLPQRFVRLAFMAYQKGDLSRTKLAKYLDTSLFDLDGRLLEYGLNDGENYQTEVRAARRQHCD
jgi:Zn-dependent peptidase ImmA (M78 family)